MTTFVFVRHALTPHTGKRLSGRKPGLHLSDEGRRQAAVVARRLAGARLRAIYSSPLERTMETAEAIAGATGLSVEPRAGLSEVDYGAWTDRSFGSLMRTKLWAQALTRPSSVRFPGGETLREVQARVVEELESIAATDRRSRVCVVTHAEAIRLAAAHYLGVHLDLFQRIHVAPASVSVIAVGEGAPRVITLNSQASLDGLAP